MYNLVRSTNYTLVTFHAARFVSQSKPGREKSGSIEKIGHINVFKQMTVDKD